MSEKSYSTQQSNSRPKDPRRGKVGQDRSRGQPPQQHSQTRSVIQHSPVAPPYQSRPTVQTHQPFPKPQRQYHQPYQQSQQANFHHNQSYQQYQHASQPYQHYPQNGQLPWYQPQQAPPPPPPRQTYEHVLPPPYFQNKSNPFPLPREEYQPRPQPAEIKRKTFEKASPSPAKQRSKDNEEESDRDQSQSSDSCSEDEQQMYIKRRPIHKRKDPVLDSKEQIRKWVEARRRNYPRATVEEGLQKQQRNSEKAELSLLEKKIRKKILIINADSRGLMKKMKDIDILRKYILNPRRRKRNIETRPVIEAERKQVGKTQQEIKHEKKEYISQREQELVKEQQLKGQQCIKEEPVKEECLSQIEEESSDSQSAKQKPIHSNIPSTAYKPSPVQPFSSRPPPPQREQLSVDVIIEHLQMRRAQDSRTMQTLMDYKSNSNSYRYQHQTLQTNLMLDNIFNETTRILQAIRYIVKNNFFQNKEQAQ